MGQPSKVAGDPRNPDNVQPYEPPVPAEPTGDIIMMLGLGCAAFGLLTKLKILPWIGLYCGMSSIANRKAGSLDLKGLMTTLTFSMMSIFILYSNPATNNKLIAASANVTSTVTS